MKLGAEPGKPDAAHLMGFDEARVSPCFSCETSPCCSYLPLRRFRPTKLTDLDYATYLLNFPGIELGLDQSGEWSVIYRVPCRFLDRKTFGCTIHNQPQQPHLCARYDPFNCWYRLVVPVNVSEYYLRMDRRRLQFLLDRLGFDEDRNIVAGPEWETLVEGFAALPIKEPEMPPADPPGPDAASQDWERAVLGGAAAPTRAVGFDAASSPCNGCAAYCCSYLMFTQETPTTIGKLDFFKFCLGFPGVELGIGKREWTLVVRTTCAHLREGRCSIFGQPERPLYCGYYDEWKCGFKTAFGRSRPEALLRVRLEQFDWLAEQVCFSDDGSIVELPEMDRLRERIESRWRAHGPLQTIAQPRVANGLIELPMARPAPRSAPV